MQDNREAGDRSSFLAGLLKKYADTKRIEEETGRSVKGALEEVNRQIKQALKSNIHTGEGVTKSSGDD